MIRGVLVKQRAWSQECSLPSLAAGKGTPPEAGAGVTCSRAEPTDFQRVFS